MVQASEANKTKIEFWKAKRCYYLDQNNTNKRLNYINFRNKYKRIKYMIEHYRKENNVIRLVNVEIKYPSLFWNTLRKC